MCDMTACGGKSEFSVTVVRAAVNEVPRLTKKLYLCPRHHVLALDLAQRGLTELTDHGALDRGGNHEDHPD
jgi:hypothetical protein